MIHFFCCTTTVSSYPLRVETNQSTTSKPTTTPTANPSPNPTRLADLVSACCSCFSSCRTSSCAGSGTRGTPFRVARTRKSRSPRDFPAPSDPYHPLSNTPPHHDQHRGQLFFHLFQRHDPSPPHLSLSLCPFPRARLSARPCRPCFRPVHACCVWYHERRCALLEPRKIHRRRERRRQPP